MPTDLASDVRIDTDTWLSTMLRKQVFRVTAATEGDLSLIAAHVTQHDDTMYWTKVAGTLDAAQRWQSLGFRCVNQQVTLAAKTCPTKSMTNHDVQVSQPTVDQHADVLRIAESCFHLSRFHVDENIPTATAHQIKREWTENCLLGKRGDRVFVACCGDEALGFLTSILVWQDHRSVAVIDLIGVDQDARGCGIGSALTQAFVNHYADKCDEYHVGTQADNQASLRLYEKFGFETVEKSQVFHLHT